MENNEQKVLKRNLDGVYFRIKDEKTGNVDFICFLDLTVEQMMKVLENRDENWLKMLCSVLGQTIRSLGDRFDLELD